MASPHPTTKAESLDQAISHTSSSKLTVTERYNELLAEQASQPDKVFIDGYELREHDPNLIVLNHDDQEHPRGWVTAKKVRSTTILAGCCFLSPFSSTIFAPSIHLLMRDLNITDSTLGALQVSIFLFAMSFGLLFSAPLSEKYGRVPVIHFGNFIFIVFSIGGGFSQTPAQFCICRFIAGLGGAAPISVVGGFVADVWDLETRPKASGLAMLGPVLGPVIGPVCGGWMSEEISWRWTLWIPAIASAILSALGLVFLPESYAPVVLEKKLLKAQKADPTAMLYTVMDIQGRPSGSAALISDLIRPFVYLVLDPALLLASLFYSVVFGTIYLIIVTYADVFGVGYGHSVGIVGTDFLAAGIGMIIGTLGTIKAMEAIFKRDVASGQIKYKPESRLLSCFVGGTLLVGGLFMYGFTATRTHFMVPLVAVLIMMAGGINITLALQLYAVDGFKFPASANAAISFLRCLFAGAFPLFGEKLFARLGLDWGVGLLGFLVLGIGCPLIILLYIFGVKLRAIGVARMERFEGSQKAAQ
ncbi:MFS general substrate transporter [Stemphylium lycopersici]|nr:MFS general substrate transporter [Stemphylium lycopersici]